jgi:hypothetical protein
MKQKGIKSLIIISIVAGILAIGGSVLYYQPEGATAANLVAFSVAATGDTTVAPTKIAEAESVNIKNNFLTLALYSDTNTNSTKEYDNVSNNAGASEQPQIALDSSGNLYVVWQDATTGNGDIYLTYWDGTKWAKKSDGTAGYDNLSNNAGMSGGPQIAMDSSGKPYITWMDKNTGNYEIYITHWDGTKWAKKSDGTAGYDNLSNNGGASYSPRIAIDSSSKPYVVWQDYTTGLIDIYLTYWDGKKWAKKSDGTAGYDNLSNNAGASGIPKIAIDSPGNPYVAWGDDTTGEANAGAGDIYLTYWDGKKWAKKSDGTAGYDNISVTSGNSIYPQILLDSSGNPYVVWEDITNRNTATSEIYLTYWDGIKWAKKSDGTAGYDNLSNKDGYSQFSQIAGHQMVLDSLNRPYVVWWEYAGGNNEVYLTYWDGKKWAKKSDGTAGYENLSNNTESSAGPQIILDSSDNPYVMWSDDTTGTAAGVSDIYLTYWDGIKWAKKSDGTAGYDNISNNAGASYLSQVVLDSLGNLYAVWTDKTTGNSDIYLARFGGGK